MTAPGAPSGGWRCTSCGRRYDLDSPRYTCDCPEEGRLELPPDRAVLGGRPPAEVLAAGPGSLWRYAPLLPIPAGSPGARRLRSAFPAGGTALHRADRLARRLGLGELWIKNEAANPTGSLKDRASSLVAAAAVNFGRRVVATASSGNAAVSMAGAAAAAELDCVVFVPAAVSQGSLAQLAAYGARVLVVDGDYEAAVQLSFAACAEWGWYCRTSAVNPYTTQGKKTAALEIAEQLGWRAPDAVVLPAGDGNILVALHHGFRDALAAGWIDRMPRLIAVQAAGAPALHRAWAAGADRVTPVPASSAAGGIAVADPLDGARALTALRESGGAVVLVADAELGPAAQALAREAGLLAEPTSAAAAAALPGLRSAGLLGPEDHVVLINTGGGRGAVAAPPNAAPIAAKLAAVRAAVPGLTG